MYLLGGTLATLTALGTAHALGKGPAALGGRLRGERLERVRSSPNHDGRVFVNPVPTEVGVQGSRRGLLRQWLRGKEVRVPTAPVPVHAIDAARFATRPGSGLRVTWMGHASALIEIDGARVLTDPVWSQRVSPFRRVGPARFTPAPLELDALPAVDVVLVSHDHYDHLDHATIVGLAATDARFVVPLGVGAHLVRWGVAEDAIVELDWWQRAQVAGLELVATPARHFSGRSLSDRNRTLWASWVVRGATHRVYFGGDSGMFDGFAEIGEREGPFDITLMPIGAYNEAWKAVHLDPEDAIQAHAMLRGQMLVPIHWGTFNLAFHDWFEPAERLVRAAQESPALVRIPRAGQPVELATEDAAFDPWWRQAMAQPTDAEPADASSAPAPV